MGRPKASTNLFDMPSRKPRQKKAAAKRRGEPEMVADTLQLLVLAHALEFGADIAVEDRRWLAARLRELVVGDDPSAVFFPGHRKGQGPAQLRNLAMALSYKHRKLSIKRKGVEIKEADALAWAAAAYGVTVETARRARRKWNAKLLKAAFARLNSDKRANLVAMLEFAFVFGRADNQG